MGRFLKILSKTKDNNINHKTESDTEIITSKDIKKKKNNIRRQSTSEFIKELQEAEEKAYAEEMELRRKRNEDIESKMICNICLMELMSENVHALDDCDHVFHESCLKEYVLNEIKTKKSILICPDSECKSEINVENLREVISKKEIETFYKNTLENFVDTHAADV